MRQDISQTTLYREAEELFSELRRPGSGQVSDATDLSVSRHRSCGVFTGVIVDTLHGTLPTRICEIDFSTGAITVLSTGPNHDRMPRFSPATSQIAFVSDRGGVGDFQLYLIELTTGVAVAAPQVKGWIEYLQWAPDGRRILLGVAGYGAEVAGAVGAVASETRLERVASWMPNIEVRDESHHWRQAWVYEVDTRQMRQVSHADCNVWEGAWCGNNAIAAVTSGQPSEGKWYQARLEIIDVFSGEREPVFSPVYQIGSPSASPSGRYLSFIDAICSDRGIVAGHLCVIDRPSGRVETIETNGVDVACLDWRSDGLLLIAGHRQFESVVGSYDTKSRKFSETWASEEITSPGRYISVSGIGVEGNFAMVAEGFQRAPEIAVINRGQYQSIRSLDLGYADRVRGSFTVEKMSWRAVDGLPLGAWLLKPTGKSPLPVILNIHGGPVWHWRPGWLGRQRTLPLLMLLERGYGIVLPNPRGSAGQGQEFVRQVIGDIGGADASDCLSSIDLLLRQHVADSSRLGVIGISYGGFMASWLVTQDKRFAAAVAVCPHTNQITQRLLSNIPEFTDTFIGDCYANPNGKYFSRSPVMHASKAVTPTLCICGALDRCTPPGEARQFHRALAEFGVTSALVTYPEEGHGIHGYPAAHDYAARVVGWFERHMRPEKQGPAAPADITSDRQCGNRH